MGFISGLKGVFKKPLYTFIIIYFICIWFLILIERYAIPSAELENFAIILGAGFVLFNIMLFFLSFFMSIEKIKIIYIIILLVISYIIAIVFTDDIFFPTFETFFVITLIVNQFFTAFFAFKLCIDNSTKLDDYFYKKEKYRAVLRILEFFLFIFIYIGFFVLVRTFISAKIHPFTVSATLIFRVIFWVDIVLMCVVLLRAIIIKKFAAYITLFFLLTFIYVMYIVFDYLYGLSAGSSNEDIFYVIISFIVDLGLFLYIIGTIYDRIDYIKEKIKLFKVQTIALFLIIMKLYVQISKTFSRGDLSEYVIFNEIGLFLIFILFILIFGIHSIFAHKAKDKEA